jgi:5-keto-L-gluconate epimerase
MKYSIVISVSKTRFGPVVFRDNLIENMKKAKNIGYDAVEFAVREPESVDIPKVKKELEKNDLFVPAVGTGQIYFDENLSFSDPNKDIRDATVKRVNRIIDFAKHFDSRIIIGLVRGNIKKPEENFQIKLREAESRISECLKKCLDYSEKFNTKFLVEPLIRYNSNILNKIEDVKNFFERFKEELDLNRMGILADTYHMNVEEKEINESFEKYFDYIKHIHFSDNNRLAPGYGHIDFSVILKTLKRKKYDGVVSFEILPEPDPDTAARDALNYTKSLE